MPTNRTTAAVLLVAASIPALAAVPFKPAPDCANVATDALYSLQIAADPHVLAFLAAPAAAVDKDGSIADGTTAATDTTYARELLAAYAMTLSNIRYHRGGRRPKTGFDCSGFVQYVFAHALDIELPGNSASQFRVGRKVPREQLRTGDLVFFHTHGRHVSHVGIYLGHGHFIHSPSTGKHVRIDDLGKHYWAKRFMGARRPTALT